MKRYEIYPNIYMTPREIFEYWNPLTAKLIFGMARCGDYIPKEWLCVD